MAGKTKEARKKAIVEACGRYYGAAKYNTDMRVQRRLYAKQARLLEPLSYEDQQIALRLGREWWDKKAMKGPGVDW